MKILNPKMKRWGLLGIAMAAVISTQGCKKSPQPANFNSNVPANAAPAVPPTATMAGVATTASALQQTGGQTGQAVAAADGDQSTSHAATGVKSATAGTGQILDTAHSDNSGPKLPTVGSAQSQTGSGGGGGGGSGSAQGPLLTTEMVHTSAVNAENQKFLLANLGGDAAGAAYAGGGGGGGAAKGGSLGFGAMGGEGGTGAAQGSTGVDLTGRNPASAIAPMASSDPENYFELSHADDNIFRIVEKRYNQKARNWALNEAKQATDSVQKLLK